MRHDHLSALAAANLLPQFRNLDLPENELPAAIADIGRHFAGAYHIARLARLVTEFEDAHSRKSFDPVRLCNNQNALILSLQNCGSPRWVHLSLFLPAALTSKTFGISTVGFFARFSDELFLTAVYSCCCFVEKTRRKGVDYDFGPGAQPNPTELHPARAR
jgi:hypothetical protein